MQHGHHFHGLGILLRSWRGMSYPCLETIQALESTYCAFSATKTIACASALKLLHFRSPVREDLQVTYQGYCEPTWLARRDCRSASRTPSGTRHSCPFLR